MTYNGPRLFSHILASGQRGGVTNQPYSAVVSGLQITAGTVTATACPLNITAGEVRLDGVLARLENNITNLSLITGSNFNGPNVQVFELYVKPTRKVPALLSAPASPANGDRYMKVVDTTKGYYLLDGVYEYDGALSIWKEVDLSKEPAGYSHNNTMLNEIEPVITSANFALAPEVDVYIESGYPHYVDGVGLAWARRSAAIKLAKISIANSAATIEILADYERSIS